MQHISQNSSTRPQPVKQVNHFLHSTVDLVSADMKPIFPFATFFTPRYTWFRQIWNQVYKLEQTFRLLNSNRHKLMRLVGQPLDASYSLACRYVPDKLPFCRSASVSPLPKTVEFIHRRLKAVFAVSNRLLLHQSEATLTGHPHIPHFGQRISRLYYYVRSVTSNNRGNSLNGLH